MLRFTLQCRVGVIALWVNVVALAADRQDTAHASWLVSQQQPDQPRWLVGSAMTAPKQVPLGSLWKLWVYGYSIDQHLPERPYQCHAGRQAATGDEYCCTHDEVIDRDTALVRSCGAYFQPERLGIRARAWQQYWQHTAPDVPWLQKLDRVRPDSQVAVTSILNALNHVPPSVITQTRQALLGRLLQPEWSDALATMGGAYRFKTFTWAHPMLAGASMGGAAGWLADGTAFWLGGLGGSHQVVARMAPALVSTLPAPIDHGLDDRCVVVHYFTRYPLASIRAQQGEQIVTAGHLRGDYLLTFANQQRLRLHSDGELYLGQTGGVQQLYGRLSEPEYLARVVDREGDGRQVQAARALSIAARSYLQQNAEFHQGCWQIDDDSRYQRVSPNPASPSARAVVAFTEGLTLTGSPIRYHLGPNAAPEQRLSWQTAMMQASQGLGYLSILKQAYPRASWLMTDQRQQCQPLVEAQLYLDRQLPRVQTLMAGVAGFEAPKAVRVCTLDYGNPYADQQSLNLYVRDWRSSEDRITLWHEYLHLAMRYHPEGQDEAWIERQARQLNAQLELTAQTGITRRNIHHAQ